MDAEQADLEKSNFERAKLVWDEYKYRHELCWKLLFQTIIAVVIVSLVPYTNVPIARRVKLVILALPALGIILTLIAIKRMATETDLWTDIKQRNEQLQSKLDIVKHNRPTKAFKPFLMDSLYLLLRLASVNLILSFFWVWNLEDE